jgi:hypothetical protein
MATLVSSSEYTVMRVSGASLLQVIRALVRIGIPLSIVTFLAGEFIAPQAALLSQQVRAQAMGDRPRVVAQQFRSGFWFKQDQTFVNIRGVLNDLTLVGVNIYEFDNDFRLRNVRTAESGCSTAVASGLKGVRDRDPLIPAPGDVRNLLWNTVLPSLLTVYRLPEKLGPARSGNMSRSPAAAEDDALRDRVLEQGLLPGRRARHDDGGAAVLVFPAAAGRRRIPGVFGDDAGPHLLSRRPRVLESRRAERLARALLRRVSARRVHLAHRRDAVVARAPLRAKIRQAGILRWAAPALPLGPRRHAAGGTMLTNFFVRALVANSTLPSTSANSVVNHPTLTPGWNLVPRWRTMMLPALIVSPAYDLTPRRFDSESRPFLELPPAFLCAMVIALRQPTMLSILSSVKFWR